MEIVLTRFDLLPGHKDARFSHWNVFRFKNHCMNSELYAYCSKITFRDGCLSKVVKQRAIEELKPTT